VRPRRPTWASPARSSEWVAAGQDRAAATRRKNGEDKQKAQEALKKPEAQ
jgi:hypothetical protein